MNNRSDTRLFHILFHDSFIWRHFEGYFVIHTCMSIHLLRKDLFLKVIHKSAAYSGCVLVAGLSWDIVCCVLIKTLYL